LIVLEPATTAQAEHLRKAGLVQRSFSASSEGDFLEEWWSAPDEEKAQHEENYKQRKKKEDADVKAAQELDNRHKQEDLESLQ